ncbi:hypothetical protein LCGC14_1521030, partial [marine sediment metagenome]
STFFGDPVRPKAPIIIVDYSAAFYDDRINFDSYVNQWDSSFINNVGMTAGGADSDFVRYMNRIRIGTSEFALIMYQILYGPRENTDT